MKAKDLRIRMQAWTAKVSGLSKLTVPRGVSLLPTPIKEATEFKLVKGAEVVSRDGKLMGRVVGSYFPCRMCGCTGLRITVAWPNHAVFFPCSKGMTLYEDGSWQIN